MRQYRLGALAATALAGLALAAPSLAQGQGGGGFRFQRPAFGTVSSVDTTANTITISGRNGQDETVTVGPNAQITTETAVTVGDLKVGDQISVQGVPTGITASSITVGTPPQGMPGGGFGGPGGGGPGGPGGPGGGANNDQGFATATGTIKTLPTAADPHLSLSLGQDTVLFIKIADSAKVNKYSTEPLSSIKSGDQIMATGTRDGNGNLTATSIGVNMQMGGFGGFGGFGGRFGGGRFGGGGAPPPPGQ